MVGTSLPNSYLKIEKLNLAYSKFRKYSPKFSFSPYKIYFFEKLNFLKFQFFFFKIIFVPILLIDYSIFIARTKFEANIKKFGKPQPNQKLHHEVGWSNYKYYKLLLQDGSKLLVCP